MSASDRSLRAKIAANTKWASQDPVAGTAKARRSFLDSFVEKVDPDHELAPYERARRAECALKAHMQGLARRSAEARRRGAGS